MYGGDLQDFLDVNRRENTTFIGSGVHNIVNIEATTITVTQSADSSKLTGCSSIHLSIKNSEKN